MKCSSPLPITASSSATSSASQHPHAFLRLLPVIQRDASIAFRRLTLEEREEAIQEVVANAFVAYARLVERGKVDRAFAAALARFAIAQFWAGRKVGTRLNGKDVLSRYCRMKRGVEVQSLTPFDKAAGIWREVVVEDHRSTPADVAAARLDIAAWLASLPARMRRIAVILSTGESTSVVARRFRLSAARISQIRQELKQAWLAFQGEVVTAAA